MLKYFKGVLFAIIPLILALPLKAQVVDKIIAKVDNHILLKSELDVSYLQYVSQAPPGQNVDEKELKCQILESLLINKLMLAKAEIDSVIVEYEVIQAQLDQRMEYFIKMAGSTEKLEETYNKSIDELKDDLRSSLSDQLVVQRMQERITGDVKVTPGEVKIFFEEIPKDSLPYFSTTVEVGQIVKIPEVGKNEKAEARQKLLSIKKQIQDGADFCSLAKQFSQDPGSKGTCGELGFFKRGELVPQYEAAALKLKPNELSDIVESEYGFHLIQLLERRSNEYNTRHILIKPASSTRDFGYAGEFLDSVRTLILNDSISFANAANKFSDDKKTKSTGGYVTDQDGNYRVSVEDIDPDLFFSIDTMEVGEISQPVRFKTEDGTEAMRILFLKSKTPPHVANLKDDYQEIQSAALENKKNKVLSDWFDKTKGEVYIHIDEEYSDCNILMNP